MPDRLIRSAFLMEEARIAWLQRSIIDLKWEMLDMPIGATNLTWRDPGNRKLQFRSE